MTTFVNDYYADLSVSRDATPEEIKKAYRRAARKIHPDVNPGPEAEEAFKKVSQAYDVLSDPDKRRAYDRGSDPYAAGGDPFGGAFSFSDVMDAFFGAGAGGARGPRPRTSRGQDALVRVEIDLGDAVFGTEHELTIQTAVTCATCGGDGCQPGTGTHTCPGCQGRGEIQQVQRSFLGQVMTSRPCEQCQGYGSIIESPCYDCASEGRVRSRRTLTMKVPAGVDTGTRIQLAGEGEVGQGGGPAGDLYVEVFVRPHPVYQRQGNDLHATLEVPMTAAALGATISLDTFDGPQDVDVAPGTQSGDTVTLSGLGVTPLRGGARGNVVVHAMIATPTRLDPAQEDLLRQLATLRGEEHPEGRVASPQDSSLFHRLREAFKVR